jgi:hypothetical protein
MYSTSGGRRTRSPRFAWSKISEAERARAIGVGRHVLLQVARAHYDMDSWWSSLGACALGGARESRSWLYERRDAGDWGGAGTMGGAGLIGVQAGLSVRCWGELQRLTAGVLVLIRI